MRRRWFVSVLAVGMVIAVAAPAVANDLDDLLHAAAESDYAGRQIVVSFVDGQTAIEIVDIEHAGSMMMVGAAGDEAVLGAGKLSAGDGGGLAVASWNSLGMSERYETGEPQELRRLGRTATAIEVREDGRLRMRLVFDDETGAPLVSEVYDGNGEIFRLSSMLEVDSIPHRIYSAQGHYAEEFDVLVPVERHSLPAVVAGYRLADVYAGPDESLQGFYSDGLFTFSLFAVEGRAESERFATATVTELRGLKYRRLVNPAELWMTWRASGDTYVLVGDLPPDHLEDVLGELPRPGRRNLFSRLWSGLFG